MGWDTWTPQPHFSSIFNSADPMPTRRRLGYIQNGSGTRKTTMPRFCALSLSNERPDHRREAYRTVPGTTISHHIANPGYKKLNGLFFISGLRGLIGSANNSSSCSSSFAAAAAVTAAADESTTALREATPASPTSLAPAKLE